jgi:hypothetical protein
MAWTDPRTWVVGEVVTASLMNTHVRDNLDIAASNSKPSVSLYSSTWQHNSTANDFRSVDFPSEDWDYAGMHVTGSSSHRIKIPTGCDGKYIVGGGGTWDTNSSGVRALGVFYGSSDGAGTMVCMDRRPANASNISMSVSGVYPAVAGGYFCFDAEQTSSTYVLLKATAAVIRPTFWATWDSA